MLRKTCAEVGILPVSYYLDDNQIKKLDEVPFASGGYSDTWRALYRGENVAIRAFRVYSPDNIKLLTKVMNISVIACMITEHIQLILGLVQGDCGLSKPLPP